MDTAEEIVWKIDWKSCFLSFAYSPLATFQHKNYQLLSVGSHKTMTLAARLGRTHVLAGGGDGLVNVYKRSDLSRAISKFPLSAGHNIRWIEFDSAHILAGGAAGSWFDYSNVNIVWKLMSR